MSRYDPRGKANRALLVGVSEYDYTMPETSDGVPGQLPAVHCNRNRLKGALRRPGVFGEGEVTVCSSPSHDDFDEALRHAAQEAEGLLLFYFAGHGIVSSSGADLFLQMRNARVLAGMHDVFPNAAWFTHVLAELAGSRAERVVVILDCCYAGNAAGIWQGFQGPGRGKILLLMSVQSNRLIAAGDGSRATPFTEELGRLLDRHHDENRELWLSDLYAELKSGMLRANHGTASGDVQEPQAAWDPGEDVLLHGVNGSGGTGIGGSGSSGAIGGANGGGNREESGREGSGGDTRHHGGGSGDEVPLPRPESSTPSTQMPRRTPPVRTRVLAFPRTRLQDIAAWIRRRLRSVAAVLLALAVTGLGGYGVVHLTAGHGSCLPPLELRVMTDPDLEPTVRAAAAAYLTSGTDTTGADCRRTGITVYSAGAADAVTALGERSEAWQDPGEDDDPQRDVGPQPDVWIPAARADVARVTTGQRGRSKVRLIPDKAAFAFSPIVLAVPDKLAGGNEARRSGRTLVELIDELRKSDPKADVRRTDPEYTDTALLATLGLYSGSGEARAGEQRLARSGPPAPTAAELLCTLPDDDTVDNRTAALVPEFLMKSGVGCDQATRAPRSADYPDDVPGIEPTFVRVRWTDADRDAAARRDAVERFRGWLTGEDGLKLFGEDGFRDASGEHRLLAARPAGGVLPDPGPLLESAGGTGMNTALEGYRSANGPGKVLFLLDSSGSMTGLWDSASGGPGILKQSLGGLGPQDEYGVWAVYDTRHDSHSELLPFGRHKRGEAERVLADRKRTRVHDAEADPHAALLAAFDEMAARGKDDDHPEMIVYLTDDEDDNRLSGENLTKVLDKAHQSGVPVAMVSLISGGCDRGRPDALISETSGGRCLDAGDDLGAGLHDEVARTGTGED
ncbi:substrate-binding domain-containing protein [Streptomyces sp. NBC_00820]|uniref:caspase family protein n=1 Tax=Streptomyces sp. NBC_00820 TaxID=2975842 RepID=UPI002ED09CC0|nr:substrate-binding domain-containing protein [Streptomyces sp. NBC_00820]